MSYIAAYHCKTGIVMCADTQETVGDEKNYVEKLVVIEDLSYPLAVAGAGFGDLIDCSTDEIIARAKSEHPRTKAELKTMIRNALKEVYEKDLPTLVTKKQHRTPELLIAAKIEEGFVIFPTKGRRVREETRKAIIGYGTKYNFELLKRLHSEDLSMQQAVMLGIYLTSQSKKYDDGVGGETRIAVVVENGAWIDDQEYVENSETRVREFLAVTDALFLDCIDMSIAPNKFSELLGKFQADVTSLRSTYLNYSAARTLKRSFGDPTYRGDAYAKVFPGAVAKVAGDLSVRVTDTPLEIPEAVQKFIDKRREKERNESTQSDAQKSGQAQ